MVKFKYMRQVRVSKMAHACLTVGRFRVVKKLTSYHSNITRKVLFYGYSYRWLRPRDNMTVAHFMERCDPIRQQLIGASHMGGMGYTSPCDEDVPLEAWLKEHITLHFASMEFPK
jgi:hypothetical protein